MNRTEANDTMRLLRLSFLLLCAGCSSTAAPSGDGGVTDAAYDATVPNTCALAGFVCQASCSAGLIDVQDLACGASGDFCCAPPGEGGSDAAEDVDPFVDGATFDTGDDASSEGGADDAAADGGGDDAGPGSEAGLDAGQDASGSKPEEAGADAAPG